MKIPIFLIPLLFAAEIFAQHAPVPLRVNNGIDTANGEIAGAIALWRNYLNSHPDSVYDNPFWNEGEKKRYPKFDFLNTVYFTPSLYYFLPVWKATVMSVSDIEGAYALRTLFSVVKDSGFAAPYCITEVAAAKEKGEFRLCNILPFNTRGWRRERVGSVDFLFPPEHRWNPDLALRMSSFVDSLARVWDLRVAPVEFYLARNLDAIFKLRGYDFFVGEGNAKGPGGLADVANRMVFGAGQDEWYPHEFVHVYINPLFPNSTPYFLEGYAALAGGSKGHDLAWHAKRLHEHLQRHPEVDLNDLAGYQRFDAVTMPTYVFGGLLCRLAEAKGGLPLLKTLMATGRRERDFYASIERIFGVKRTELNDFARSALARWAAE